VFFNNSRESNADPVARKAIIAAHEIGTEELIQDALQYHRPGRI